MEGEAATDSRLEDDSYKENEEAVTATNEAGDSIEGNYYLQPCMIQSHPTRSGNDTGRYHIIQHYY